MNGTLIIGSRDATNLRIEKCFGKDVCLLFGKTYFEHIQNSFENSGALKSIIEEIVHNQSFGEVDSDLKAYLISIESEHDSMHIRDDFVSYCEAQDKADQVFLDPAELCRRSLTSLANCANLSCDESIVTYC